MATVRMERGSTISLRALASCACSSLHFVALLSCVLLPTQTDGVFLQFLPRFLSPRGDTPSLAVHIPSSSAIQNTLSWGVKLRTNCHRKASNNRTRLDMIADDIAARASLMNHGQVGELCGHYLYKHRLFTEALNGTLDPLTVGEIQAETEALLHRDPSIEWVHRQWIRSRTKRGLSFDDPMYPQQWHLHNSKTPGMDINVTEIWSHNITGEGIVVAVIDDGLEWTNPDIRDNYEAFSNPAPTPTHSPVGAAPVVSPVVSPVAAVQAPAVPDVMLQQQMVAQFIKDSGMNAAYSQRCLEENGWDYPKAGEVFLSLMTEGKIPPEAFIQQP